MRMISSTHTVFIRKGEGIPPGTPFDGDPSLIERGVAVALDDEPAPAAEKKEDSGLVNINTATIEELAEAIPRVGFHTARDIVASRPFLTVDDLVDVGGVSKTSVEKARSKLTV